jgi:hypothetical protein
MCIWRANETHALREAWSVHPEYGPIRANGYLFVKSGGDILHARPPT